MNVLFLTMDKIITIEERRIYPDLMRKFRDEGHEVYIVCPTERRERTKTRLVRKEGVSILSVQTLNVQKTNIIEKGLGQVSLDILFNRAISKYLSDVKVDLILYCTPPITLLGVVKKIKKKYPKTLAYLMLKDIFPQNAVDLSMLTKSGLKGVIYKCFRKQEKELYRVSDVIGCMSPANVIYVLKHNPEVDAKKVEICPNSFMPIENASMEEDVRTVVRKTFQLPVSRPIFLYGGNLGKPQGIPFLLECLKANKDRTDCHFIVIGDGTEYLKIEQWVKTEKPRAVSFIHKLPQPDYDKLSSACDVGLIFLDYRFTIPNYPSRLLSYLTSKIPIIAATDPHCDIGALAEQNGYGLWCPSNSVEAFTKAVDKMLNSDLKQMGEKGYQFYLNNYTVQHTYNAVMSHFRNKQ